MKRLVEPAIQISDMPAPDLILLSHAHMDHFDLPTLRPLENPKTTVVTACRTCDLLRVRRYAQVHELGGWRGCQVGPAEDSRRFR